MNDKILILCQYFYPEYVSSAMLPTQLSEELNKKGIIVDVICGQPKKYYNGKNVPGNEMYNGVKIKRVKYMTFNDKKKLGRIINFFSFFVSVLMRFHKILKYKVVFVYSNPPILPLICYWASKFSRLKFVFVGFDLYPDNALVLNAIKRGGIIEKLMRYINDKVYSSATNMVAISSDMKDYMTNKYSELQNNKVKVIPNWYTGAIDITITNVVSEEFINLREKWDFIVLYTGNMGEAQDLDTIIDAIVEMKKRCITEKTLFVFTGHGSRSKEIQQRLLNEKVDNVKFYGFLKGQDFVDILNISDVCLASLKSGIEGLGVPSKIYGYFAFGKPVIVIMSSKTELAMNINAFNAGASVSQGDKDKFIELIVHYRDNPELLKKAQIGSARIHEELYEKQISINKYYNLIKEILN